jgi:hypothetical protein
VREVAGQNLSHGAVEKVERSIQRNGEIRYDILFKRENGTYQRLVIAEDGRVLEKGDAVDPSVVASGANPGAKVVAYSELPETVRRVAGQHLRDGHVQRVERGQRDGQLTYDIVFRKDSGEFQRLVLTESGTVLKNEKIDH